MIFHLFVDSCRLNFNVFWSTTCVKYQQNLYTRPLYLVDKTISSIFWNYSLPIYFPFSPLSLILRKAFWINPNNFMCKFQDIHNKNISNSWFIIRDDITYSFKIFLKRFCINYFSFCLHNKLALISSYENFLLFSASSIFLLNSS